MADQDENPDCWEDIDEEDLLRRLDNRQKKQEKPKKPITNTSPSIPSEQQPSVDPPHSTLVDGPMKIKYSEGTTEYVAPIKILKRPDRPSDHQSNTSTIASDSKQSHKSLAQREAEYNTARARILGSNSDNSKSSTIDINVTRQPKGPPTSITTAASSNEKQGFQKHPTSR